MSKRPNLAPPFARIRNTVWRFLKRPLDFFSPTVRFIAGFSLLVLATTLLIVNPYMRPAGEIYKEGEIVRQTIVSPADIIETDESETQKWRLAAAETVRPIFAFESNRAEQAVRSFRSAWEDLHRQQRSPTVNTNENNIAGEENSSKQDLRWTGQGGFEVARVIIARKFNQSDLELLNETLRENAGGYIYADAEAARFEPEITIVDRNKPSQQSTFLMPQTNMTALSAARQRLRERIFDLNNFTTPEKEVFYQALAPLVTPSVIYDARATMQAKESATQNVTPATITLKRGQTIVREGDTVTSQVLSQLAAIRAYTDSTRQWNRFFGLLFIIAALYWVAQKFVQYRGSTTRLILSSERTFALVSLAIFLQTILLAIGLRLADFTAAQNLRAPFNDPNNWALIVPFAAAALLVTLLIDAQIGLIVGIFSAFLAALMAPKGVEFSLYAAISSAMAVYGFESYRSRQAVTIAGLLIGGVNAAVAVALIGYTQQPFILNTVLLAIGCGFLSGIVTAAVTSVLLPIFESAFGILTDVKLLELSNADLPVLGQLAVRAPGTNQHSHSVGQLAEDAARSIGANPLLARIGALYHDIGKLAAPDYFVENQNGTNPHDRLKPKQSTKIITAHISYGQKLAKEIGLPQRIIDFIPQHHGTRTLHYFLKKAQSEAKEDETVNENDFRYAGPKPQFKEAAVMMIADSCEAAARSLEHPTEENIRFIVNKIIDAILGDDQFDECDLTLRELTLIRESMIKSLVAIHHSRCAYPGFTPPEETKTNGNNPNGAASNTFNGKDELEKLGVQYSNPKDIPISKGGEVEDEAISLKAKSK